MCTALSFRTKDHYFGRNLDLDCAFREEVCVTPRRYPFHFRQMGEMRAHYAMIGMASVVDGYPLYYDATNEKGLSMAGLNFPGNAYYGPEEAGKDNVAPFEFIGWMLGQCANVAQAREKLARVRLAKIDFSPELCAGPLHWLIADRDSAIVVEPMRDGLHVYDNPVKVLTNNPPFPYHLFNLNNYRGVGPKTPENTFCPALPLAEYTRGLGGLGIPGDLSSMSRFVKIAYTACNSRCGEGEEESVSQFFHLLTAVEQQRGAVEVRPGEYEMTLYTSCVNTDRGVYYYTTYGNRQISAVDMRRTDLDGTELSRYPLVKGEKIHWQN